MHQTSNFVPWTFASSSSSKHPSTLHHPLQFFQQRCHLRLRLRRAFAVKRFQANLRHLLLQFLAENRRAIGSRVWRRFVAFRHALLRLFEPFHGVTDGSSSPVLRQLLE